jgi:hypothetical protein
MINKKLNSEYFNNGKLSKLFYELNIKHLPYYKIKQMNENFNKDFYNKKELKLFNNKNYNNNHFNKTNKIIHQINCIKNHYKNFDNYDKDKNILTSSSLRYYFSLKENELKNKYNNFFPTSINKDNDYMSSNYINFTNFLNNYRSTSNSLLSNGRSLINSFENRSSNKTIKKSESYKILSLDKTYYKLNKSKSHNNIIHLKNKNKIKYEKNNKKNKILINSLNCKFLNDKTQTKFTNIEQYEMKEMIENLKKRIHPFKY